MHTESSPHSATSQSKDLQNFLTFLSLQEQTSEMRNLKKAAEAGTQGRTRGLKAAQSWLCTQAERQHTRSRSAELQRAQVCGCGTPTLRGRCLSCPLLLLQNKKWFSNLLMLPELFARVKQYLSYSILSAAVATWGFISSKNQAHLIAFHAQEIDFGSMKTIIKFLERGCRFREMLLLCLLLKTQLTQATKICC